MPEINKTMYKDWKVVVLEGKVKKGKGKSTIIKTDDEEYILRFPEHQIRADLEQYLGKKVCVDGDLISGGIVYIESICIIDY